MKDYSTMTFEERIDEVESMYLRGIISRVERFVLLALATDEQFEFEFIKIHFRNFLSYFD